MEKKTRKKNLSISEGFIMLFLKINLMMTNINADSIILVKKHCIALQYVKLVLEEIWQNILEEIFQLGECFSFDFKRQNLLFQYQMKLN